VIFDALVNCTSKLTDVDLIKVCQQYHSDLHSGEDLAQKMFSNKQIAWPIGRTSLEPASDRSNESKITQCQKGLLHTGIQGGCVGYNEKTFEPGWPSSGAFERAGIVYAIAT
jgi:hypothetical protein